MRRKLNVDFETNRITTPCPKCKSEVLVNLERMQSDTSLECLKCGKAIFLVSPRSIERTIGGAPLKPPAHRRLKQKPDQ